MTKLLLTAVAVLCVGSAAAQAQLTGCDLVDSLRAEHFGDTVSIPFVVAKPGNIVLVPVQLHNISEINAFNFLVEFDPYTLRPVLFYDTFYNTQGEITFIDSSWYDYQGSERLEEYGTYPADMIVHPFQNRDDVISCMYAPDDPDPIPPGNDTLLSLMFWVNESVPDYSTSPVTFYQEPIFFVDTTVTPPDTTFFNGCLTTEMSVGFANTYPSLSGGQILFRTDCCGCCNGYVGNVNASADEAVDGSDLDAMLDALFVTLEPPACFGESDLDYSGRLDGIDLSILLDYLMITHRPLRPCPF